MIKVFVPRDSTALSLGADKTAKAIAAEAQKRGIEIELVRNGSRGLFWLEPFVEIATDKGRVAFAPVQPKDVPSLFDANFLPKANADLDTVISKQQQSKVVRCELLGISLPSLPQRLSYLRRIWQYLFSIFV